ncbi:AraC family transcriptional regulator [Micromonospora rosaria]|uniref:AraC family transcriptional regulator n=1 Tax=Micromonospora rosaria TaxID=47874 RepID=A0A136PXB9_9ACTN|nr:GlxA family transcriptional regulator [Micromonospora rosaria]KXK63033.1 AraC family transcriptional regulator [Micromonospora rosaria]
MRASPSRAGGARDVVIAAGDGAVLLDVAGPLQVFALAAKCAGGYRVRLASPDGRPVHTREGVPLGVDTALDSVTGPVDILLVAGCDPAPDSPALAPLAQAVRRLRERSTVVASVCIGAFVLAEAGLLDGRRATTHWASCQELADRYPQVTVKSDGMYVRDGDVYTAAGVTAGIDLALALVERDRGGALARQVAQWLVVFLQRPAGQSQLSVRGQVRSSRRAALRAVLDAVAAQPHADHSLEAMAGRAALSPRHLSRLFIEVLGTTPGQYVQRIRVEAAQQLLEAGDDPVEVVARQCGFRNVETMRKAFHRIVGMAPTAYRHQSQKGVTHA